MNNISGDHNTRAATRRENGGFSGSVLGVKIKQGRKGEREGGPKHHFKLCWYTIRLVQQRRAAIKHIVLFSHY